MPIFPYGTYVNQTSFGRLLRGRSKRTSPCYEIHGRNIWQWDNLFRHGCIPLGTKFNEKWEKAILDVKTPFKRKPSSIYIFTSCHPTIVKMDLRNEQPESLKQERSKRSKSQSQKGRKLSWKKQQRRKTNIAFRDTIPALRVYYKKNWNLIQNQPLLWIF